MRIDKISPEAFERIVDMAAFALEPDEKAYLLDQLNLQLQSVQELLDVPLEEENAFPKKQIPRVGDTHRVDQWQAFEKPRTIVERAPQNEDGMFLVPEAASGKDRS